MITLTQRIDSLTGKLLEQTFHRNGHSKVLFTTKYDAIQRTHDEIKFVNRHNRRMIVYNIYLLTI